ncbi:MAG: ABC transporter ATP-binding protein [bacterium]
MIRTEHLYKKYESVEAVKDLNLSVEPGEIYGFLGPNGAGKTTTIMMILGIVKPTRGKILIFDRDLYSDYFGIKRRIGVVSETQYLYEDMTAYEYLSFFCDLYGVEDKDKKIEELLHRVNLYERKDDLLGHYSRGMQQKIGFVRALLMDPQLLILDEPVSGLDPTGIREVRDLILEENKLGRTVFMSSHILSEVERISHRVGILNKGMLVAEDTMDNIKKKLSSEVEIELEVEDFDVESQKRLEGLPFVNSLTKEDGKFLVRVKADKDYRNELVNFISSSGAHLKEIKRREMSLEEAFLTITEKNISLFSKEEAGE